MTQDKGLQLMCGTGVLRAKPTTHAVIRDGKISLPGLGQCFIDGHCSVLAREFDVDIIQRINGVRTVVGQLHLPVSKATQIEGSVTFGGKVLKCVATLRNGQLGPYRALRLPDVKIAPEDVQKARSESGQSTSKYAVA